MLALTRRCGETIRIGDTIIVTVLGVSGGSVRIGVEAPRDIPVDREEVYERKKAGNQSPERRADGWREEEIPGSRGEA